MTTFVDFYTVTDGNYSRDYLKGNIGLMVMTVKSWRRTQNFPSR